MHVYMWIMFGTSAHRTFLDTDDKQQETCVGALKLWKWIRLSQWSGRFRGIIGWDPGVCKSNRLHFEILRFSFMKLGYIQYIPLTWSVTFLQSWTSSGVFVTN